MKRILVAAAFSAAFLAAGQASAQDLGGTAGLLATAVEGFGQTLGDSMTGGQSVFVTAHGKARLPAPLTGSYYVNVEGTSHSAVEAGKVRDARLAQLRTVAKSFGIAMELGESRFTLDVDHPAQAKRMRETAQANVLHPGVFTPADTDDIPKVFKARTGVRFTAPSGDHMPAFLDALRSAGVDEISGDLNSRPPGMFQQASEILGFGSVEKIDDAIWDAASADAIRSARSQAQTLAAAAGRNVGEARQILFLAKAIQGGDAVVTIAVRFGFAPKS